MGGGNSKENKNGDKNSDKDKDKDKDKDEGKDESVGKVTTSNGPISAILIFKEDANVDVHATGANMNSAINAGTVSVSVLVDGEAISATVTEPATVETPAPTSAPTLTPQPTAAPTPAPTPAPTQAPTATKDPGLSCQLCRRRGKFRYI